MASCPPIRGHWHSSRSPEVAQFLQRTVRATTPLFMADAFAPALLLYHPPRGLRDNGLAGNCNRSARSVSRTGECDMLRLARALVRNATHPTTAARFGRVRPALQYCFLGNPYMPGHGETSGEYVLCCLCCLCDQLARTELSLRHGTQNCVGLRPSGHTRELPGSLPGPSRWKKRQGRIMVMVMHIHPLLTPYGPLTRRVGALWWWRRAR